MKKKLQKSTLIIGIIVAALAMSNSRSYADKLENTETTELKMLETEMFEVIGQILDEKKIKKNHKQCIRFYNTKNQLVYESRDKDDEHLKILLRRSDLVLQTDSSSYYLLGD